MPKNKPTLFYKSYLSNDDKEWEETVVPSGEEKYIVSPQEDKILKVIARNERRVNKDNDLALDNIGFLYIAEEGYVYPEKKDIEPMFTEVTETLIAHSYDDMSFKKVWECISKIAHKYEEEIQQHLDVYENPRFINFPAGYVV